MRLRLLVTASFVLVVSTLAFAQEWVEYTSPSDFFFVNFPAPPKVQDITYTSEFGAAFPARVYNADTFSSPRIRDRSTRLRSSRTLPGHSYCSR